MAIEYLGLSQINGSLIAIEGMKDAAYDEVVEIVVDGKQKKLGRIVACYEDKAMIQVFEGSENMSLTNTHTRLTGHPMELALSPDIWVVPLMVSDVQLMDWVLSTPKLSVM